MATIPLGAESARNNPLSPFATFDRSTIASAEDEHPLHPRYGEDQSKGPISPYGGAA